MDPEVLGDAPTVADHRRRPPWIGRAGLVAGVVVAAGWVALSSVHPSAGRSVDEPPVFTGVPQFLGGPMLREDRSHDTPISWYAVDASGGRVMSVGFTVSGCSAANGARVVSETPHRVDLVATVVSGSAGTTCPGTGSDVADIVVLRRPLGDRRVRDARSGEWLPRQRFDHRPTVADG
ncbi:MAG: hypothetical protein WAN48_11765 [Actinomycetes bacterium]